VKIFLKFSSRMKITLPVVPLIKQQHYEKVVAATFYLFA